MKATDFHIRRARVADLGTVQKLSQALQRSDRRLRLSRRLASALPRDYVDNLHRVDRCNAGRLLVAVSSNKVIAYLACTLQSDLFESNPLAVKIADLFVTARWRRKRVGAALIDSAVSFARERNARAVAIATLAENVNARRAYRFLGFKEAEVVLARRLRKSPRRRSRE
jgi:GNAT superfamily N-acetyltransferase